MNYLEQTKSVETSERYSVITTKDLVTKLESKGFEITSTSAVKPRKKAHEGFQKHMIRLTHADFKDVLQGNRPEIIIINSYNGSTALNMFLGAYRFACANGLMVGTSFGGVNVRHVGNVESKIDTGLIELVSRIPDLVNSIQRLQLASPSNLSKATFLNEAYKLVVPEHGITPLIKVEDLVIRQDDASNTAYNTFNIVQELCMRRGVKYYNKDSGLWTRTRQIKSVSRQVEVNRKLWDLAESLLT